MAKMTDCKHNSLLKKKQKKTTKTKLTHANLFTGQQIVELKAAQNFHQHKSTTMFYSQEI